MATVVWIALLSGLVGLFFLTRSGGDVRRLPAFRERGALVLDVRTPQEFAGGHIRGAVNIPVDQLGTRVSELDVGPVIVYCASGVRSRRARAILEGAGFDVLDMSRLSRFPPEDRV